MGAGFNVNDRQTWAWTAETMEAGYAAVDDVYALNVEDPSSFFQFNGDVPTLQHCPLFDGEGNRQVYDPTVGPALRPAPLTRRRSTRGRFPRGTSPTNAERGGAGSSVV